MGENQNRTGYSLTDKQKRYLPLKRAIDLVLSGGAIAVLSPVLLGISVAIKLDSPGPIFFKQRRVGKDKELFTIWKFRTMRIDTPKDMPTHMLSDPDQYITKTGKFLRKTSLDELPQIFQIFCGQMTICGPRPALWNQDDLIKERDKYGANCVRPGLTGWAQINGRDELEIPVKAKLDGEYVKELGFKMDVKCLFGTIHSVLKQDGVVEGGTGELYKKSHREQERIDVIVSSNKMKKEIREWKREIKIDNISAKKILITGTNSYIGMSVDTWLSKMPDKYKVDTIDMTKDTWKDMDFSIYDVIFHVAGIAHADVGSVTEKQKQLYYKVNTDLAVEVAKKAKEAGVSQFIFMSSMIVYSGCKEKIITSSTVPKPLNFYGDSKWQADQKIRKLLDKNFKVVVLRPPMIYGKGSKGNYPELVKLATKLPVFPAIKNKRSMLHIDNLCQFVKLMIDNQESGIFFPQNREYTNTSDMVRMIAHVKKRKIIMIPRMKFVIQMMNKTPGKIGELGTKAFGDLAYDMSMSEYKEDYRVRTLMESIELTEG
ncbi:UDP-glucose:undecaprenyl-phosphate glucose-1-phosphate transferase [Clostridiales bacterium CHKCI001]|nr:UDP-glucose:undecaprenyl-phosphate glucose-1-phosphate transferase [Clostridiales bacterium CHKCI001]